MEDLIKRSDAIEQLNEAISICPPCMKGTGIYRTSALEEAIDIINQIPSADRPQGEWETEYHGNGWNDYWDYTCSNCGKKYERADAVLYKANFCPNCGARMKGADEREYERAIEQMQHDILYEPTYNPEDGSM